MTTFELLEAQIVAPSAEFGHVDLAATVARFRGQTLTTDDEDLIRFVDALELPNFEGREIITLLRRVSRTGVSNDVPPRDLWGNLAIALRVAQGLRDDVGPLRVTSCYRSPAYNDAIGGVARSTHRDAIALDLVPLAGTVADLYAAATSQRGQPMQVRGLHTPTRGSGSSQVQPNGLGATFQFGGTLFTWKGGIGRYAGFVHVDVRGRNANWRK